MAVRGIYKGEADRMAGIKKPHHIGRAVRREAVYIIDFAGI